MAEADTTLTTVTLKNLRLSYPDLFAPGKPQKNDAGVMVPGKYKCNGIMYKTPEFIKDTNENLKKIKAAKEAALIQKYNTNDPNKWPKYKPEKLCVRDGNLEEYDGYANSWYISASEQTQPLLLSRRRDPDDATLWLPATPTELYGGCYVNMIVNIWIQDNQEYGKRVNANLKAVQFMRKGPAFGGSQPIAPRQAFTEIEEMSEEEENEQNFNPADDDDDDVI